MTKFRRLLGDKLRASFVRSPLVVLVTASVVAIVVTVYPLPAVSGGSTTTTTTTTTTVPSVTPMASGEMITAGPSRSECLTPNTANGQSGISYLQYFVGNFESQTDSTVTCLSAYLNGSATWSAWVQPWVTQVQPGYSSWVAQAPLTRQLVLALNLIPNNLVNINNPTGWERSCAEGDFDSYATQLGQNLVAAGLQNSVIRLGLEMNGVWENDFIGKRASEQKLWARCFANEVTSLRKAGGEHFLMDWNPNACVGNYPYANFYPGNAYVDIVGLDLYDVACNTPNTSVSFQQLANEPAGLNRFEAFAKSKRRPMSLPEWGLSSVPSGDDPSYINGIGQTVANGDFAFETYFEGGGVNVKAMALGPQTPLSLAAFRQWFGSK